MDDPVNEIEHVVRMLTQGSPKEQEAAVNKYCTTDFAFTHPFCRTGSFEGSRLIYQSILRWYKIMSPRIDLTINSIAYDEPNLRLYVSISQIFAIWFIPFHSSPVTLTTELQLLRNQNDNKYLIRSQNDLYQVDQFIRFVLPWGIGTSLVLFWHIWATFFCCVLAFVFTLVTVLMQRASEGRAGPLGQKFVGAVMGVEGRREELGREEWRREGRRREQREEVEGEVVNGFAEKTGVKGLMGFASEGGRRRGGGGQEDGTQQFGNMQVVQ